jgi:UDP-3-O-[3-hydroxymyristoyl] N-acetylglucosamine deacetylase/3-hydroxyacyl-[acyl-carrier-protein] dehydratase
LEHLAQEPRRTVLRNGNASVQLTEHILAALAGLNVDNCLIEVSGPEPPGMDGSALAFAEGILQAGLETQSANRHTLIIEQEAVARSGESFAILHPQPSASLDITYNLDYAGAPDLGRQSYFYRHSPEDFVKEIAPARTFIHESEVPELRKMGIGLRATERDLLVIGADGKPINNSLRFPNECARHKILDCLGDLTLLGRPVHGHLLAHRSGHALNAALVKAIKANEDDADLRRRMSGKPLLDAQQIAQIMPHRFPFLLLDRVIELDPNRSAVGIKNVTYNEPFFQGHWPGRPVMPGVLIVEAMAQLAGVMLTQWQAPGRFAMIISLNNIKLRRAVVPGDQLRLVARTERLKSRTAVLETQAWVDKDLAASAQIRLVMVEGDEAPTNDQ